MKNFLITSKMLTGCFLILNVSLHAQPTGTEDTAPSWSADGKLIGFSSARTGNLEIYTMDVEGKNLKQITNNPATDQYPVWSPSGQQIAFQSDRDGNSEIYVMNQDGSNLRNLTNNSSSDEGYVAWSRDGKRILFSSNRKGNFDIYSIEVTGGKIVQLTDFKTSDNCPSFLKDDEKIVFTSMDSVSRKAFIRTMDSDGKNVKILADDGAFARASMDGKSIVFQTTRDGKKIGGRIPAGEIYCMNADGSNQRNLTNNNNWEFYCFFSPDSKRIVFTSIRSNQNQEVYIMDADGKNEKQLTFN